MFLKQIALTSTLLVPLSLIASGAIAGEKHGHDHGHGHDHDHGKEHRQHDAHVHGIAALNLALEGDDVHIELNSPAANIVGFEHKPSSEADHAALDKAVAILNNGDQLFVFNSEADCKMEQRLISSTLLEEGHGHDKHDHDKHDHDKHAHDDHGHDDHNDETHSDIEVAYHFECDQPDKLTQLTVELFEAFPATEELNVQYVIENKQGAVKLNAKDHVIKF